MDIKRSDIKGKTIKLPNASVEVVTVKGKLSTIAIYNKAGTKLKKRIELR